MKHINLETFSNGKFSAQVNRAMEEVTKNIQDPNTDAGAVRKITVTIAFKPNDERNFVTTGVVTKTTLAPALGTVTAMSMGKNLETGEVEAVEIGNQIPGQLGMALTAEKDFLEESGGHDPVTGEIHQAASNNIVDLRAKQA